MKTKILGLLVAGLLAVPMVANAGYLGQTVEATAFFPTLVPPGATTGGPVSAVVGAGTEFSSGQFGAFFGPSFDFADTTITVTHAASGHQTATFNGYQFFDLNSSIDSILGVSILSDSTGFFSGNPSRITWDANNVWINFQSLNFTSLNAPTIVLGVQFASVPEPGAIALLGLGLAGLALARRRKQ